jgi:8-oxo-dGTP diphosphatase
MKQFPKVGVGVMLLKNGKVLLGKRHSDPEKADSELHGEGTWTMPGGKLEFGEKLVDAAYRETLEETGIKIDKETLKLISVTDDIVPDAHFVTIGFLCRDFSGEAQVLEPDEIVEWKWFELDKLPSPLFGPSRKILEAFKYIK